MMGLLRAVAKSNRSIQTGIQDQGLMLSLSRQLSTQMETPQKDKDKDNSSDPFLQNPSTGKHESFKYFHKNMFLMLYFPLKFIFFSMVC